MTSTTDDILALHNAGTIPAIVTIQYLLEDALKALYPFADIITTVEPMPRKGGGYLDAQIVTSTAITTEGVKYRVGIEVSNDKRYAERSVDEAADRNTDPEMRQALQYIVSLSSCIDILMFKVARRP